MTPQVLDQVRLIMFYFFDPFSPGMEMEAVSEIIIQMINNLILPLLAEIRSSSSTVKLVREQFEMATNQPDSLRKNVQNDVHNKF